MRHALCLSLLMATGCSKIPGETALSGQETRKETAQAVPDATQSTAPKTPEPSKDRSPRDDQAIPQDRAKTEKRERERMEWHFRTSVGAYDKVGKKDPRWDDLAQGHHAGRSTFIRTRQ